MSDKYKDIKKYLNRAYKCTRKKEMLEREYKQKQREVGNISVCYDEIKTNNINIYYNITLNIFHENIYILPLILNNPNTCFL